MSRLTLLIKAVLFRGLQTLGRWCDLYLSPPLPQRVSFKRVIPSTVSAVPGSIALLFYTPPSYASTSTASSSSSTTLLKRRHPLLINFHGGGFTIGHAADDARWATCVTTRTSGVVVSVNYRLAPTYPFPTGLEDCVSAILYLWQHADELNLDISRTALSGFSAGGNFTYAVAIRLQEEIARLKRQDKLADVEVGEVMSLVSFYPSVDWTQSREERDASNLNLIPLVTLPMYRLFDESYLSARPDMSSPLLSPAIASDELLMASLPEKMVLITCYGDQLLAEGEKFRKRLRALGKRVDGHTVPGVGHGWDKFPSFGRGNQSRDEAYEVAVKSLKEFWGE